MKKPLLASFVFVAATLLAQNSLNVNPGELVNLPKPQLSGGESLNQALAHRRSVRTFTSAPLTLQEIAQLAWSAQGVTDDNGHRTAPSARAMYFLDLFIATPEGFFQYLPADHQLRSVLNRDIRSQLSTQDAVRSAAVVFLIAGQYRRAATMGSNDHRFVDLEAGHAAQNLLLQATALHLGAVPVGGIEPALVKKALPFIASDPVYLVPVGHPK